MNDLDTFSNQFLCSIENIIKLNKLSHSYLIEIDNDEDIKYINYFIKLILCQNKVKSINDVDCRKCNICSLVDSNNYPDLKYVETDGQWIKKNQLLEIKDDFKNKSLLDNKKIYVIKYAENLNLSSANSILKFLEEPEDNIIALLLTKNRYKVINTITSRCQILSLKNNENNLKIDDSILDFINYLVNPSKLFIDYKKINDTILTSRSICKEFLIDVQKNLVRYLDYETDTNTICDDRVVSILSQVEVNKIIKYVTIIEEEISNLDFNVNIKIWLDGLFSRFVEVS